VAVAPIAPQEALKLISPLFVMAFLFPFFTQLFIVTNATAASWFKVGKIDILTYLVLVGVAALSYMGVKLIKVLVRV
jgi:hypothetical protein